MPLRQHKLLLLMPNAHTPVAKNVHGSVNTFQMKFGHLCLMTSGSAMRCVGAFSSARGFRRDEMQVYKLPANRLLRYSQGKTTRASKRYPSAVRHEQFETRRSERVSARTQTTPRTRALDDVCCGVRSVLKRGYQ